MPVTVDTQIEDARTVRVELASGRYDVHVGRGLLAEAGARVRAVAPSGTCCVVADERVAGLHLDTLRAGLEAGGYEVVVAELPTGETHKRLATLLPVYETLLAAGIDRGTPVVGFGGGVATDMAGFVAATLLRGVPLVQVPTSLLAMVDASVGGKTGVNAEAGKNLIGAFHQPAAVLIDPDVLTTLPPEEMSAGLAECIKHEVIRDAAGFADLERDVGRARDVDLDYLAGLVAHNVAIKATVVAADPLERGERAHLNLGHTFAHAIEKVTANRVPHGPAVGLGLVAATRLAVELDLLPAGDARRVERLVAAAGLPTGGLDADTDAVVDAMRFDKKVKGGRVRFVLPDGLGAATLRDDVPPAAVREAVASIRG